LRDKRVKRQLLGISLLVPPLVTHLSRKPNGEDVSTISIGILHAMGIVLRHSLYNGETQASRALTRGARIEAVEDMITIEWLIALIADNKTPIVKHNVDSTTLGTMHIGILHKVDNCGAQ
jgi:hypothetical protein